MYTINDKMSREKTLFKRKLFRTIAKLGLVKILSMSNKEFDETIFVYSEQDSKPIISNLAITLVNVLVDGFKEATKSDDCVGTIINKNIRSMATAFM